jgi:membrane associated rhomboid family serine protease
MPPSNMASAFGPGPITPAVRALIIANVAVYVAMLLTPARIADVIVRDLFGLTPSAVIESGRVWQLATYLFLHSSTSIGHILFNMLALWMFGVELERRWGTTFFTKYYFVCGVGAALCTVAIALLPFDATALSYRVPTIGASGAIYGLLLAWALLFPDRRILFMFIFPLSARVFVLLIGAIAFVSALQSTGGPVSNIAHLGGLVAGWLYLRGPKDLQLALKYRLTRWRMERMRRRFNVHQGGRGPWDKRVH